MKKIIFIVLICLLMVSCATLETKPEFDRTYNNYIKVKGKDGIQRPNWVTQDISNETYHFEVGISDNSNLVDAVKIAKLDAKASIAEWVNSTLKVETNNQLSIKGNANSSRDFNSKVEMVSNAILINAVQEDVWVSADNITYVLVSVPVTYVESQIKYLASLQTPEK